MSPLLAYFLTWTCYGTWLPGDSRGWVSKRRGPLEPIIRRPDPEREAAARRRMPEPPALLSSAARGAVHAALRETCQYRNWHLHALAVRSNHVHVVISAAGKPPGRVTQALKANASRALRALSPSRRRWWTKGGSMRYLNNDASLAAAIAYVERQDKRPNAVRTSPPR